MALLRRKHTNITRAFAGAFIAAALFAGSGAFAQGAMAAETNKGSVVSEINVKQAPSQTAPSEDPTIDPVTHSDTVKTNSYINTTYYTQPPYYLNGELQNGEGTTPSDPSMDDAATYGALRHGQLIDAQHDGETIIGGWWDGTSAWIHGINEDTKTIYLYRLDGTGKILETTTTESPDNANFDSAWTLVKQYSDTYSSTFTWNNGQLQIYVVGIGTASAYVSARDIHATYGTIPVDYVDTEGNKIADSDEVTGILDTYVTVKPKEIPGYRLVQVPYENDDQQFLINGQVETTPTDDFEGWDSGIVTYYYKVIDNKNTQERYLVLHWEGVDYTSSIITSTADPEGVDVFTGGELEDSMQSWDKPTPVGSPLKFVYAPIQLSDLTIKYVEKGTGKVLYKQYDANGAGSYDVVSPVLEGYTADKPEVKGSLTKDTTITVTYSPNGANAGVGTGTVEGSTTTPTATTTSKTKPTPSKSVAAPASHALATTGSDVVSVVAATLAFAVIGAASLAVKRRGKN